MHCHSKKSHPPPGSCREALVEVRDLFTWLLGWMDLSRRSHFWGNSSEQKRLVEVNTHPHRVWLGVISFFESSGEDLLKKIHATSSSNEILNKCLQNNVSLSYDSFYWNWDETKTNICQQTKNVIEEKRSFGSGSLKSVRKFDNQGFFAVSIWHVKVRKKVWLAYFMPSSSWLSEINMISKRWRFTISQVNFHKTIIHSYICLTFSQRDIFLWPSQKKRTQVFTLRTKRQW